MDDDELEENLKDVDDHSAEEQIEQIFNNKQEEHQSSQLSGIDFGNMGDDEEEESYSNDEPEISEEPEIPKKKIMTECLQNQMKKIVFHLMMIHQILKK